MHCDISIKWKLLSNKQEQTTHTYNVDDSQEYYAEQNKPDTKAGMLYSAICFKFVTKADQWLPRGQQQEGKLKGPSVPRNFLGHEIFYILIAVVVTWLSNT